MIKMALLYDFIIVEDALLSELKCVNFQVRCFCKALSSSVKENKKFIEN